MPPRVEPSACGLRGGWVPRLYCSVDWSGGATIATPTMHTVVECFAFLLLAYGYAFTLWGFLISQRARAGSQIAAAMAVFFTLLVIGPQHVMLRAFALLIAVDLTFKMIDYARHQRRDE